MKILRAWEDQGLGQPHNWSVVNMRLCQRVLGVPGRAPHSMQVSLDQPCLAPNLLPKLHLTSETPVHTASISTTNCTKLF